jgi:hypothetical protein
MKLPLRRTLVRQQFYSTSDDNSNDASRKTYFHLRLSIQYVKFLKNGMIQSFFMRFINPPFLLVIAPITTSCERFGTTKNSSESRISSL